MSEVNYRRNGMKYSTSGKCWGVPNKVKKNDKTDGGVKTKSSRERRVLKKGR